MLTPDQRLKQRKQRQQRIERKALQLKWKSGKGGTPRKRLGPVLTNLPPLDQLLCMSCGTEIGILNSVPGKMISTFHRQEKDGARFYLTPQQRLLRVQTVDHQMIPHLQVGRVCQGCVSELTEILSDPIVRPNEVYADHSTMGFGK